MQIRWKIVLVSFRLQSRDRYKLLHIAWEFLSWHVRKFVVFWWRAIELHQCEIFNEFGLWTNNLWWNMSMVHYSNIIMSAVASHITDVSIVYWTVCSGEDQRKYQSSASLSFVRGVHWWLVNSAHKGPITRKMFPFDYAIMYCADSNPVNLNTCHHCSQRSNNEWLLNDS